MRASLAVLLLGMVSVLRPCMLSSATALQECVCPGLSTSHACTCTAPRGYITTAPTTSDDVLQYNIDVGHISSVAIYFSKSDLRFASNSSCSVTIGDHHFGSSTKTTQDQYVVTVDTNTPIYVVQSDKLCQYQLKYSTYDFEKNVTTIHDSSGVLDAPEDPNGNFQYRPNCQYLWILEPWEPNSQITISVEYVDLGAPYDSLHDNTNKYNYTMGDFLFIGAGDDILGGKELLLYGHQERLQVVIPSGVGHVFFYSTTSVLNGTGFNLTFNSTAKVTTPVPTTTVSPIPSGLPKTFVAINGIPVNEWRDHNDTFRQAIASMASDYLQKMNYPYPQDVTEDMVYINDMKTCNPVHCKNNCVAYKFSMGVYIGGSVVFTEQVLNQMLADQDLQYHISDSMKNCQICNEHPKITTWVYVVVPVGAILIAIIISVTFWKCSKIESSVMAHEKYEKEQWERREDQRRRSSGDVSILGLGTSLASQGSLNSRRFTMPFPKAGKVAQDDDGESLDMSGFREYDPDLGVVDPSQFGLEKEFMKDKNAVNFYTNEAFVPDEEEVIYQRDGASCSFAGTDSDDSEGGGALNFHNSEINKQSTRQIIVPADVHSNADAEETAL